MFSLRVADADLRPGPAAIHDRLAPVVGRSLLICVEGAASEWAAASMATAAALRGTCAVTIGLCLDAGPGIAGELPAALEACDLRLLVGDAGNRGEPWNGVHATAAEARSWVEALDRRIGELGLAAVICARTLRVTSERAAADGLWIESITYSLLQTGQDHDQWLAQNRHS